MTFRVLRLLVLTIALLAHASVARGAQIFARSLFESRWGSLVGEKKQLVAADSTGTACAYSRVGTMVHQTTTSETDRCSIGKTTFIPGGPPQVATVFPGVGRTKPKFLDQNVRLLPLDDLVRSSTTSDPSFAVGGASWASFVEPQGLRSRRSVMGYASPAIGFTGVIIGAAEARDPLVFDFASGGAFDVEFFVGSTDITLDPDTGLPVPSLSIFSDDPNGEAHLDVRAALSGAELDGVPLDGDLFLLTIDAAGVVDSPSDLAIEFLPWSGLGLTASDVAAFVSYFESTLSLLPDGSVGLAPGTSVALIGPGSPIPTLTFDAVPGFVTYSDVAVATAQSVPEPAPLGLLSIAAAWGLLRIRCRRGPSSRCRFAAWRPCPRDLPDGALLDFQDPT
jgi:hypothetical protein